MSADLTSDPFSQVIAQRPRDVEILSVHSHMRGCGLVAAAVVWNAITGGVAAVMLFAGDPPFFAWFIIGFFGLVGVALAVGAVKDVMARSRLHPPRVTLAFHPLCVGEEVSGRFEQQAKSVASIEAVTVRLICRESATYRRGTDTTTVTHDVHKEEVRIAERVTADPANPIAGEFHLPLPEDAMHSFDASNNKIVWLLQAHTAVAGWPDYQEEFALTVMPRRAPGAEESR